MVELDPTVEQQLADMSDEDWHALSVRVRPASSRRGEPGHAGAEAARRRFGERSTKR